MKYIGLIMGGLRRKLTRSILTGLSIVIAFLLLGVTNGVLTGFDEAREIMSDVRLRTISRANMTEPLPFAHYDRIRRLEGIVAATPVAIFPAYYQEQVNNVVAAAVDIDTLTEVFPKISLSPDEMQRMHATRTGATVGSNLAQRFGWKIGDQIPLRGYFTTLEDGGTTLTVDVVSIHNDGEGDEQLLAGELYFHYDYLNESRAMQKDTANLFLSVIESPENADRLAEEIDAMFANSHDETQTMNEKQFLSNQAQSVGNIGAFVTGIQFAVMFTLLFIAGSTMTQSVNERIGELGVFKAIGFSDGAVVSFITAEALILCLISACIGLGIATVVFPSIFGAFGLTGITLSSTVWVVGLGMALALACLISLLPALTITRLSAVDALRRD